MHPIDQVTKQLHKLVNVIKIRDLEPAETVARELALFKISADGAARGEVMQIVEIFRGKIIDVTRRSRDRRGHRHVGEDRGVRAHGAPVRPGRDGAHGRDRDLARARRDLALGSPAGTIALLFTDIEGSTTPRAASWAPAGPRCSPTTTRSSGGAIAGARAATSTASRATRSSPPSPTRRAAARAAVAAQRGARAHAWPAAGRDELRVRMGLHVGHVERRGDRLRRARGPPRRAGRRAPRTAARSCSPPRPRRSSATRVRDSSRSATHRLKDFPVPELLFCAVVDGRGAGRLPAAAHARRCAPRTSRPARPLAGRPRRRTSRALRDGAARRRRAARDADRPRRRGQDEAGARRRRRAARRAPGRRSGGCRSPASRRRRHVLPARSPAPLGGRRRTSRRPLRGDPAARPAAARRCWSSTTSSSCSTAAPGRSRRCSTRLPGLADRSATSQAAAARCARERVLPLHTLDHDARARAASSARGAARAGSTPARPTTRSCEIVAAARRPAAGARARRPRGCACSRPRSCCDRLARSLGAAQGPRAATGRRAPPLPAGDGRVDARRCSTDDARALFARARRLRRARAARGARGGRAAPGLPRRARRDAVLARRRARAPGRGRPAAACASACPRRCARSPPRRLDAGPDGARGGCCTPRVGLPALDRVGGARAVSAIARDVFRRAMEADAEAGAALRWARRRARRWPTSSPPRWAADGLLGRTADTWRSSPAAAAPCGDPALNARRDRRGVRPAHPRRPLRGDRRVDRVRAQDPAIASLRSSMRGFMRTSLETAPSRWRITCASPPPSEVRLAGRRAAARSAGTSFADDFDRARERFTAPRERTRWSPFSQTSATRSGATSRCASDARRHRAVRPSMSTAEARGTCCRCCSTCSAWPRRWRRSGATSRRSRSRVSPRPRASSGEHERLRDASFKHLLRDAHRRARERLRDARTAPPPPGRAASDACALDLASPTAASIGRPLALRAGDRPRPARALRARRAARAPRRRRGAGRRSPCRSPPARRPERGRVRLARAPASSGSASSSPTATAPRSPRSAACARLEARGPGRFAASPPRWRELAGGAVADAPDGPPGAGLVAVGGFAFAPDGGARAALGRLRRRRSLHRPRGRARAPRRRRPR